VRTTFPTEIAAARPHARRPRGSFAPTIRSTASITSPPASARVVVITDALVKRSAADVTGYAAPAHTTETARIGPAARSVARIDVLRYIYNGRYERRG
jgi:hypothetical protein